MGHKGGERYISGSAGSNQVHTLRGVLGPERRCC